MIRVPTELQQQMIDICQRMYARGLVAGADGNVSVRFSRQHILATPTGMSKGMVRQEDLAVCDLDGKQLQGSARLTTEIKIHLAVYQQREDVCAVVHAHPPHATAHAVARQPLDERLMPEAYIAVGKVALTPYGTPSTHELEDSIRPAVVDHDAVLLSNHGALTVGRDLLDAYHRMEALEQLAHITLLTRLLGNATPLSNEEMARLEAIRGVYGTADAGAVCWNCGSHGHDDHRPHRSVANGEATSRPEPKATSSSSTEPTAVTTTLDASHVHWPGNPPVWKRPPATPDREQAIRSLAEKALRELRGE
jgi:L-fuculose-phosphate aldolase